MAVHLGLQSWSHQILEWSALVPSDDPSNHCSFHTECGYKMRSKDDGDARAKRDTDRNKTETWDEKKQTTRYASYATSPA